MLLSLFALMQLLTYMLCMKKYFITFKTNVALFDLILAPSYNILSSPHSVGSMAKLISLNDDDEEPLRKVCTKSNGVHKFAISFMLFGFETIQHVIIQ